MDTSITIALVIAVLFVFMLPASLRRIDRTLTHGHVHDVPATARECAEVRATSCLRPADAPRLYAADRDAAEFEPPQIVHRVADSAPVLHLSKPAPRLAVIDGDVPNSARPADSSPAERGTAHLDLAAPLDPEAEAAALPLAVGQTAFLPLSTHHEPMDSHMTSSQSPATGPSMQHRTNRNLPAHLRARIADSRHTAGTAGARVGTPAAGQGRGPASGAPAGARGEGSGGSAAPTRSTPAADRDLRPQPADRESSEKIARLRAALPFVGLGFLATALATLVTAVLVPFGVLPWAVPVLTLVLAGGCLLMVRSINLSIRRLRRAGVEAPAAKASATAATPGTAATPESRRTPDAVALVEDDDRDATVDLSAIRAVFGAGRGAEHRAGAENRAGAERDPGAGTEVPRAQAPTATEESRESADSAEPTKSSAPDSDSAPASSTAAASSTAEAPAARHRARRELQVTQVRERVVLSLGTDLAGDEDTDEPAGASVTGTSATEPPASGTPAPAGSDDLLATRFAATGWNPSPVPTPTYVDAPVVDRAQPEPVVADASSFRLEPQSKESLAERFAAELGYRPEFEDAAREDDAQTAADAGPLAHGRTAIGGARTRGVGRLDEVLARRRA
ncbi:hypothetical protein [uncultured Brevibacterium sp.]|uniref:hypothetical protein n=1 Tax=uncultured Brevibacterium sp. TaxID=189678 RepID=UPI0025FD3B0C|nr:hypothetical protein [uncultured Brevibacterium sp.]